MKLKNIIFSVPGIYLTLLSFACSSQEPVLFDRIKNTQPSEKWELIWSDEFKYRGLPDSSKWNYDTGGHGWGNNEKQFYREKSIENSYVENGILHISAIKKDYENSKYTSAKLTPSSRFLCDALVISHLDK